MKHLALALFLTSAAFAQSRFDGTWQMKMDTLQFSGRAEDYLIEKGMYHCLSCVPKVDVKIDGTDQPVAGHEAYYDSLAVRIVDTNSVEFTFKKDGKPIAESTETVSPDGRMMTEEFANNLQTEKVAGKAGFARVGAAPPGSHALSGQWQMLTVKNATRAGTLTIYRLIAGGMKISDSSQTYEAKFDGKDYPTDKDGHWTVSLKLIDDYTMEEIDKQDGKVFTVARMTVSRDGKSMRVESSDKQRGSTMTYTAEKQP